MPTFYLGATYVLLPQFDAETTIAAIERERITHIMLVPTQIIAILASKQYRPERLASLECIVSLGAPLLQEHKDRLNADLPHRFYELYGCTEGFVTILDRDEAVRKSGSVGRPTQFFEMRIVDAEGRDLPPREVGEIVGRGPIRMQGYYKRPDLTAQAVRDGWIYTGDLGYADEDGYLYLVDRKKDMIDSGGMKVYPKDVEEIAAHHPAIREVAVFGVPHDKWGETPLAAVILRDGATATAEELRDMDQRARGRPLPARLGGRDLAGLPSQRCWQDAKARDARAVLGRTREEGLASKRCNAMRVSLDHAHIFASNLDATVGFFRTMFDATVVWDDVVAGVRGVRLQLGRAFILIYDQPPKAPRGGAFHHLGIETDDLDGLVRQMESRGFVFRKPVQEDRAFKYVMISGPDELLIELRVP